MKFKVKDMDIATGGVKVALLNEKDANHMDLHHNDRVLIKKKNKQATAVLNIAESSKAVSHGKVGLFEESLDALSAEHGDEIEIMTAKKPASVGYIKKKLDGTPLKYEETYAVIKDIVDDNLTSIEMTAYIDANYIHGMTLKEVIDSTKAMVETGSKIDIHKKIVTDVHGIGGVPGNRTTPIIVAILAAAGLTVPKTSSRAITSPSGTSDTMDIFCDVAIPIPKLKKILKKTGAFLAWGGAEQINLAPADDKIIKIEHPLEIDAEGQMLASIMAKKASVCATHLLLEISFGLQAKLKTKKEAHTLSKKFRILGKELGIKIFFYLADGSQPIGNGIGPALEAKDVLLTLLNDPLAPKDLRAKSLKMAAMMLEFTSKAKIGHGQKLATKILESGNAYSKFMEIIKAQGGRSITPNQIPLGKFTHSFKAKKSGSILEIDNKITTKICRAAGAPSDHGSGIFFHKKKGDRISEGDILFTIYSQNQEELDYAIDAAKHFKLIKIS